MKTFVINLLGEEARRKFMRGQLESLGIDYEFFDAVLGSDRISDPQWYDDSAARVLEDRSLRHGEVGCAISHSLVYAEIVRRGLPCALILEDDAILHPTLPNVLHALESGEMEQGDIVFLERCDHIRLCSAKRLSGIFSIAVPILVRHGNNAGAGGYVVTAKAAAVMMKLNIPVRFPADNWGYYRGFVRFKGIIPTLTLVHQEVSFGSAIAVGGTRQIIKPYSIFDLLWNSFKTYSPLGRALKHTVKRIIHYDS
jgi:glycosyl transferase family 25